jgi:hypothetical protein
MSTRGSSACAAESHKALRFLARLASEFTAVLSLPDLLGHVMRVLREENRIRLPPLLACCLSRTRDRAGTPCQLRLLHRSEEYCPGQRKDSRSASY